MGGLTTAAALTARGIEVEVYEQADRLLQVGAGIQMTPNAVKVIRGLGLESQLSDCGFLPRAIVGRDWQSGKTVFRTPLQGTCETIYGAPYVQIHRGDLQQLLLQRVPERSIHLGASCIGVRNHGTGAVVQFAGGREIEADLVIGADGVRSIVRRDLFGDGAPRFTGNICWRSVVQFDEPDFDLVTPDTSIWFGPNGHIVTYYVKGGKAVNIVACLETEVWHEESWNLRSTKEELAAAYPGWNENLQRLFQSADDVFKWGLFDRDPMANWTIGRVTLLGDAAHPMLPYLSQGAAMAMEDGFVLAQVLCKDTDIDVALRHYQALRIPRTSRVQLASREQGKKNHLVSPWARLCRDVSYRIRELINPQATGLKAGWVYEYDAVLASSAF
jgi:salicylate hydroxylase